jgi:hypothetical protein
MEEGEKFTIDQRLAPVLAVDDVHVYVLCPYCGLVHRHGSGGDLEGYAIPGGKYRSWGHRLAHCHTSNLGVKGGYYLIGNEYTITDRYSIDQLKGRKRDDAFIKAVLKEYRRRIGISE